MRKSVRTMWYLADTLWSYDRSIFFYFAVSCVLGACLPYVGILMPQYIVSGLLTKEDAQYWGLLFGILGIVSIGVGSTLSIILRKYDIKKRKRQYENIISGRFYHGWQSV